MKVKGLRWWILGLIVLVTIINYLDRNTLGIMWQTIVSDLGLVDKNLPQDQFKAESKKLFAAVNMCFMVAYGLSQLLSGKLYDRIGTRKGFSLSVLVWGIADALTCIATGFKSICGFRSALGLGVAGPWPGAVKSNAEWFPQKQRALAQGLFNAGASIGAILAPILIVLICSVAGWKWTFVIIGCFGLIWLIPWLLVNKKGPAEHPWITDAEKAMIMDGRTPSSLASRKGLSWGQLLSNRKSYAVILGRFFLDPIWWMFVTWLPIYLFDVYGFNVKDIGMMAWVPYVGAALGSVCGGWVSGRFVSAGRSVNFARKASVVIGACITLPSLVYVAFVDSATVAVICMAVILFGYQFTINNIQTLPSDLFTGGSVGSLAGLGGAAATLGTILSICFIPSLTAGGNWTPFFIMGAALVPLSVACVFIFGGKIEQQD